MGIGGLAGVGGLSMISGCIDSGFEEERKTEFIDMFDRSVKIPGEIGSFVCLGSGCLRMTSYLLAGREVDDFVVGVEDYEHSNMSRPYSMAFPEFQEKPIIGPSNEGDAEKILSVDPDVILAVNAPSIDHDMLQEQTGKPVVKLDHPSTLGGISNPDTGIGTLYDCIEMIGDVLGFEERADEVVSLFQYYINDILDRGSEGGLDRRIFVGGATWRGAQGIRSTIPIFPPLKLNGFKNMDGMLEDVQTGERVEVDPEKLIEYDPEIMFVDAMGEHIVREDAEEPEYRDISAVKSNQVYRLYPYNQFNTEFTTVLVNSYLVGRQLNPDNYSDIEPVKLMNNIYSDFFGEKIAEEMVSKWGAPGKIEL
ncbi:ABC-type Fe(3+)-hydroxamate transport system periplasmic component [Methanonatronarchaeum thermophilum]|uniref:ABC-type Fe(3+)-hydroxamate transport system periplasmic component n=2 Tax=Methanonatronarchaeum thermophilum TaxID=1927129 RepID=A0A1Y3GDF4_9EURY|nr:ABC-type Fe(3+)-hydroxamate transport system periplasmic component [Methanonatronarchaeum thermophilum]